VGPRRKIIAVPRGIYHARQAFRCPPEFSLSKAANTRSFQNAFSAVLHFAVSLSLSEPVLRWAESPRDTLAKFVPLLLPARDSAWEIQTDRPQRSRGGAGNAHAAGDFKILTSFYGYSVCLRRASATRAGAKLRGRTRTAAKAHRLSLRGRAHHLEADTTAFYLSVEKY